MSRRRAIARPLVIGVAALLLAGCAGPGTDAKLDPEKTPLTKYFDAIYGSGDDNEVYIAQAQEAEELVAACMSDEGFEYIPVDQSQYYNFEEEDGPKWGTKEFVIENGYGMQQSPEQIEEMNSSSEEFVDPNQDYVATISETEKSAYY